MRNGWTGGQYSVYRALLGAYLFVHFLRLVPWGREVFSNQGVLGGFVCEPAFASIPEHVCDLGRADLRRVRAARRCWPGRAAGGWMARQ